MIIELKTTATGVFLLLSIISGIWMSYSGKPLNTFIFTIHKLLGLATVIFAGMAIYSLRTNIEINPLIIILVIVMGLSFIALFVTGALLSLETQKPGVILLVIHRIGSVLVIVSAIIIIVLARLNN